MENSTKHSPTTALKFQPICRSSHYHSDDCPPGSSGQNVARIPGNLNLGVQGLSLKGNSIGKEHCCWYFFLSVNHHCPWFFRSFPWFKKWSIIADISQRPQGLFKRNFGQESAWRVKFRRICFSSLVGPCTFFGATILDHGINGFFSRSPTKINI